MQTKSEPAATPGDSQKETLQLLGLPLPFWAVIVVLCVAACHLVYGLWFWTHSPTNAPKTSLSLKGDAFLESFPGWNTDNERDAASFNRTAMEVLRTGVPRTRAGAFYDHAPAYSYFLAACYAVGGVRLLSVVIPQAVLSGLTGLLVALAAYRLAPRWRVLSAVGAALLMLVDVRVAACVGSMNNPTPLLLPLHALAFYLATGPEKAGRIGLLVLVVVLAMYTTASYFLVGGAAALWLLWRFARTRGVAQLAGAAVILGSMAVKLLLVELPGESLREDDKATFWYGNNPYYESMSVWDLWAVRQDPTWTPWLKWRATDSEKTRYNEYLRRAGNDVRKAGWLWARENPGHYAKMCLVRLRATLGPVTGHMRLTLNKLISTGLWLLVFPAGFWGLWQARRTAPGQLAWLIVFAVCGFETMVFAGLQLRYRLPVDLMLAAFAAVTYAGWFDRIVRKSTPEPQRAGGPEAAATVISPDRNEFTE